MHILVGLGNPGNRYQSTRHNVGFLALDYLAAQLNADAFTLEKKFNAEVATAQHDGNKVILVKPQTFMNNSGHAVRSALDYYKLLPRQLALLRKRDADLTSALIVIHDDIDIVLGSFKIQTNRSAGGHNGVQSIIEHLKTQNFIRVRIGVASSRLRKITTPEKFVLEKFSAAEQKKLATVIPNIVAAIQTHLSDTLAQKKERNH